MSLFAPVENVAFLLAELQCPWFICGGWAIDLFLGRVTREHKDVDIAVARNDQFEIRNYLISRGWDLRKAINGELHRWIDDEWLELPIHNVWCEKSGCDTDFLEILFNEIDEREFRFRRDQSIKVPIEQMSFRTASGLSVLAPEIVLLYKSNDPEGNEGDFNNAAPLLSVSSRRWLSSALSKTEPGHSWLEQLYLNSG
jgi:hypothetical protein